MASHGGTSVADLVDDPGAGRVEIEALERAERVYDLYRVLATVGVPRGQRVNELAQRLTLSTATVRRDLALAMAPYRVRDALQKGEVGTRTVVMMQGLPEVQQLDLLARIRNAPSQKEAQFHVLRALEHVDKGPGNQWSAGAVAFEYALSDVHRTLEELTDMSTRSLREIWMSASGGGRRELELLIDEVIGYAGDLKQALARISASKEGDAGHG